MFISKALRNFSLRLALSIVPNYLIKSLCIFQFLKSRRNFEMYKLLLAFISYSNTSLYNIWKVLN